MRHDLTVSESILINAPPAEVWKGLTDPALIKEYLFGASTTTDWKPGSEIVFQGEYGGLQYRDKGVVQENVPMKKLSYTYWSSFSGVDDTPENYSLVTYTLESSDGKTTSFTWTQKGFASEQGYEHSKGGMKDFMEKIKSVIER